MIRFFTIIVTITAIAVASQVLDAEARCLDPNVCVNERWFSYHQNEKGYFFNFLIENTVYVWEECRQYLPVMMHDIGGSMGYVPVQKCVDGQKWILAEDLKYIEPSPILIIVQVKDQDGKIQHIQWIEDRVPVNQFKGFELSWNPPQKGQYTVTAFAWKSFENMKPLLQPISYSVFVE